MVNELAQFLAQYEFERIVTNLPEFIFFYKQERQSVNVLMVVDYRPGLYLTNDQFDHLKQNLRQMFEQRGATELHILSLVICDDCEKAKAVSKDDRFCWQINPTENRLIIYENRVSDFYGVKGIVEQFLERRSMCGQISDYSENLQEAEQGNRENRTYAYAGNRQAKHGLPIVSIFLVAVNVILYLICTWYTDLLYNEGDLVVLAVLEQREYYRILTSMFLHADINHLFSNMIVLYFLGEILERELGHFKYSVLYLLSGIGAAFVSMAYQYHMMVFVGSIGASGAIYGVLGALLWLILIHKGRYREATLPRMLFFLIYSLYSGFQAANVDNAAHIGGLICGFVVMIFLWRRSRVNEG